MVEKQILSIVMENEEGALARLTDMFSARGFSIENINAGTVNLKDNTSSITITLCETDERIKKLILQLQRLIPVVSIKNITKSNIEKEIALINAKGALEVVEKYSATKIKDDFYELVASPNVIDDLVKELNDRECFSIVRSGIVAIG
ncbi:MAG: acetolactate synthase small subunit [Rickettsiales bacterium]|jgi:acetolactate synthase-1/3 small subunit|nr:acetolactate synthase small subunit [Rickettsiales bacterium]